MKNFFEGANFGDKFLTRDGKIAIYIMKSHFDDELANFLLVENTLFAWAYNDNGKLLSGMDDIFDIVSRYEEPIDEKVVQKLGNHYLEIIREPDDESSKVSFTTGYRMGWIHMTEFVDYCKAMDE